MRRGFWKVVVAVLVSGSGVVFSEEGRDSDLGSALKRAVETREGLTGLSLRVTRGGEVVFEGAEGDYLDGKYAFEVGSPVRIASMTKPITATAVAVLVSRGEMRFEDPVDKYLPEFSGLKLRSGKKVGRVPTVAECLSHTAGFKGVTVAKLPRKSAAFTGDNAAVVTELLEEGLVAEPGTRFDYTKLGYDVVAKIVEKLTGKRFDAALRELVLEPLEMGDTAFRYSEIVPGLEGRDSEAEGMQYFNPAGGLISTASDLTKFFAFHLGGGEVGGKRLVEREVLEKMHVAQPNAGNYGLGFRVLRPSGRGAGVRIEHGGATGTVGWADFETGLIFIGLSQNGSKVAAPVWDRLGEMVDARYGSR